MRTISRSIILLWLVFVFIGGSLTLLVKSNVAKPRIMIIHSLSKQSSWASAVDLGLDKPLLSNRIPVSVTREYLNLDVLSEGVNPKSIAEGMRSKVAQFDPQVLIVVDDESSELVGRYYVDRPNMKIIFTGLMHDPKQYGYNKSKEIWGIRERIPLHGITTLFDQLFPEKSLTIAAVGVSDLTGSAEMKNILDYNWGRHQIILHELASDFVKWKETIEGPAKDADILLVLSIDKIPEIANSHRMVPENEMVMWTEKNSKALPIGIRSSYARMGGGLAISSPPTELGYMAMDFALHFLDNSNYTPSPHIQTTHSYDISIRRSAIAARKVSLPQIYIEAARGSGNLFP